MRTVFTGSIIFSTKFIIGLVKFILLKDSPVPCVGPQVPCWRYPRPSLP